MKLYDSNGNYLIDTDNKESFNHGTYGKLYMYNDDTCLKIFNNPGFHNPKIIETLKEIELAYFYKIIELLYNENKKYAGYLCKYYNNTGYDILSNKDYLLDCINGLYNDIIELTRRYFRVSDLHRDNIIINKDGMTMIDADDYQFFNTDNTHINIIRFKNMLKEILYHCIINFYKVQPEEAYRLIKRLVDEDSDDINHFNNVMKRYKKPIDYFSKTLIK